VSHFPGTTEAQERLLDLYNNYGLGRLVVTDSFPHTGSFKNLDFITIAPYLNTWPMPSTAYSIICPSRKPEFDQPFTNDLSLNSYAFQNHTKSQKNQEIEYLKM